jgi:lysophospholipase L1-like esterase
MDNIQRLVMLAVLVLPGARAADAVAGDRTPQVVEIGDNERVVHIIGTPFDHAYCEPRLEMLLIGSYACRGLTFRAVPATRGLADLLKEFDARVLIHRPTLVIIQAGNDDLNLQYRRVAFDFSIYRPVIEDIVRRLRAAKVKVVLCSVIPRGSSGHRGVILPPNDGLQTWVAAAREIAARHQAAFVDLFTEALDWPMISNPPTHYDREHQRRSWELLAEQLRFQPGSESCVEVDAKAGAPRCRGATLRDRAIAGGVLSFTFQNAAAVGPVLLKVTGLPRGAYVVTVDGMVLTTTRAEELVAGINLAGCLQSQVGTPDFNAECSKGRQLVATLAEIHSFKLPAWVKVADFREQKRAAVEAASNALKRHDETMRDLVTPRPLAIRIAAVR